MELNDDPELRSLLREWKVPSAPAALDARVLKTARGNWARLLRASIRVPVPLASCVVALVLFLSWRSIRGDQERVPAPAAPRVVVTTKVVEVPVVRNQVVTKFVYRNGPQQHIERSLTFHELRPVEALRPVIIRGQHGQEN